MAVEGLKEEAKIKSFPTQESGGFIWVWMGDADNVAEFEPPSWAHCPDDKIAIVKIHTSCNWAQVLEGSIDSAHSSSLHSSNMPPAEVDSAKATATSWPRPSRDKAPRIRLEKTDFGFHYAAVRTPIIDTGNQRLYPGHAVRRPVLGHHSAKRPVPAGADAGAHG